MVPGSSLGCDTSLLRVNLLGYDTGLLRARSLVCDIELSRATPLECSTGLLSASSLECDTMLLTASLLGCDTGLLITSSLTASSYMMVASTVRKMLVMMGSRVFDGQAFAEMTHHKKISFGVVKCIVLLNVAVNGYTWSSMIMKYGSHEKVRKCPNIKPEVKHRARKM